MASLRYLNMEMLHEQRKQLPPRGRQNEHDGLLTNRLLWLGASAAAFFLWGSGCHNLALRAFMNKPWRGSRTDMEGRSLSLPAPVSIRMAWRVCFHKPAVETQENVALRLTEHTRSEPLRMLRQVCDPLLGAGGANGQGGSDFIASFLHQPCRKL